jgi:hypothetical protein
MRRLHIVAICSVALLIVGMAEWYLAPATTPEPQFLIGRTWQAMSYDTKVAYIWGMGNLAVFERALRQDDAATPYQGFLSWLVQGLQGKSLTEVVSQVDAHYRAHPEQIERPVIDGLFQAVVLPALLTSQSAEGAQ